MYLKIIDSIINSVDALMEHRFFQSCWVVFNILSVFLIFKVVNRLECGNEKIIYSKDTILDFKKLAPDDVLTHMMQYQSRHAVLFFNGRQYEEISSATHNISKTVTMLHSKAQVKKNKTVH